MAKILGLDQELFQGSYKGWTPEDGFIERFIWEGPKQRIRNLLDQEAAFSADTSSAQESRISATATRLTIVVSDSGLTTTEEDNSVWGLVGNQEQIDIRLFPLFANRDKVTVGDLHEIDGYLDGTTAGVYSKPGRPVSEELYRYMAGGTLYYINSSPVLTRRINKHRNNANFESDYTNSNRVVTLDSIDPPTNIIADLSDIPFVDEEGDLTTGDFEWLKQWPRQVTVKNHLESIHYEWWGASAWSQTLYGGSLVV